MRLVRDARQYRLFFWPNSMFGIHYQQRRIRLLKRSPSTFNAQPLDTIIGIAQPGRVDHVNGHTIQDQLGPYRIPCRTWHFGDDRDVLLGKSVQETGLPHVGATEQGGDGTVSQQPS